MELSVNISAEAHFLAHVFLPPFTLKICSLNTSIAISENDMIFDCHHSKFVIDIIGYMKSPCHETFTHLILTSHSSNISTPIYSCSGEPEYADLLPQISSKGSSFLNRCLQCTASLAFSKLRIR
jgi:hypothetical protein